MNFTADGTTKYAGTWRVVTNFRNRKFHTAAGNEVCEQLTQIKHSTIASHLSGIVLQNKICE